MSRVEIPNGRAVLSSGRSGTDNSSGRTQDRTARAGLTRRELLVGGGSVVLASLAGCTAVGDLLVDVVYRDLNVLNDSSDRVEMHIRVLSDRSGVVFDETVTLDSGEAEQYGGLWTPSQSYTISVELSGGISDTLEIDPVSEDDSVVVIYGGELELDHYHGDQSVE